MDDRELHAHLIGQQGSRAALNTLMGRLATVVIVVAIGVAAASAAVLWRMEDATGRLLLSEAQLTSALKLRAAARIGSGDAARLLVLYGRQIGAGWDPLATLPVRRAV